MQNRIPPAEKRLDFLDGIRGWAAVFVVITHVVLGVVSLDNPNLAAKTYLRMPTNGHLCVLIFFVLSGFVLTVSQLKSKNKNLAVSTVARYFRLAIPITVVSLAAYLFLKLGLFYNIEASTTQEAKSWLGQFYDFKPSILDAMKFSSFNVFFNYDPHTTYDSSLWTMPYEMMGSLLIYAYIAIFRQSKNVFWLIIVILCGYFYKSSPYLLCFMAGHFISELNFKFSGRDNRLLNTLLLISIAGMIYIDTFQRPESEQAQALEAIAIVFIITFCKPLLSFFSNRLSLWLGKISFSLYLIQIIVICSWSSFLKIHLPTMRIGTYAGSFIIIFSTLGICLLLARFLTPVDEFAVQYSKKFARLLLREKTTPVQLTPIPSKGTVRGS